VIHGQVLGILARDGPLTGGELLSRCAADRFLLWKTCACSRSLVLRRAGDRYLRLDERVPGFSRLSPSILREFLTYTVVGTEEPGVERRAVELREKIRAVGEWKTEIARDAIRSVMDRMPEDLARSFRACFILGGDIVYGMAHAEPRPERSTGRMVRGSDLDVVVVVEDRAPAAYRELLDGQIHREKFRLLSNPAINQELDYVVKTVERFREQLAFDTFKHMVACKIMREGVFLQGDRGLFTSLKSLLAESGVEQRLSAMEEQAAAERQEAEEELKRAAAMDGSLYALFYSSQESDEFE
jgi:hypothetical protein